MKPNYNVFVILVLVLFLSLLSSSTSARLLRQAEQEQEQVQDWLKLTDGADLPKPQGIEEEFSSLMGSDEEERCDDEKDAEECVKRRMMGEAHLDYIYTQHHKP